MQPDRDALLSTLRQIVSSGAERVSALQSAADALCKAGGYRWVGVYDVDDASSLVKLIVYSGPSAPEFPTFPITKGLTSVVISAKKTVNVGNVAADPRYLTAFGSTRSEMIIPVPDAAAASVAGTIDIESEQANAFDPQTQERLEACAAVLEPLWQV